MASVEDTLTAVGIAAWGGSMPVMSPDWTDGALPAADDGTLTLGSGNWLAPIAGTVTVPVSGSLPLTLIGADGDPLAAADAVVLTFDRRAYLRLARLYAEVLESATGARPERARGLPFRPVPLYVPS